MADVIDDVGAAVVGEINVNVRRVDALGIEEALEEQAVADGVHVRDFEQIGDKGTGGRTARDAGDAVFAAVADEIGDDEEIGNETGLFDDREFHLQPVNHGLDGGGDGGVLQPRWPDFGRLDKSAGVTDCESR